MALAGLSAQAAVSAPATASAPAARTAPAAAGSAGTVRTINGCRIVVGALCPEARLSNSDMHGCKGCQAP